jgi:hypothetical protein
MSLPANNPNNCACCDHYPDPAGQGHCYMWQIAPSPCLAHSSRRQDLAAKTYLAVLSKLKTNGLPQ